MQVHWEEMRFSISVLHQKNVAIPSASELAPCSNTEGFTISSSCCGFLSGLDSCIGKLDTCLGPWSFPSQRWREWPHLPPFPFLRGKKKKNQITKWMVSPTVVPVTQDGLLGNQ